MAFYLVEASPYPDRLDDLKEQLDADAFTGLRPFGPTLSRSLRNAHVRPDGSVVWEEEDYCSPPLAEERGAVLDRYFQSISVEPVPEGEGWAQIRALPPLFPELRDDSLSD